MIFFNLITPSSRILGKLKITAITKLSRVEPEFPLHYIFISDAKES